jgi:hypothetical protein
MHWNVLLPLDGTSRSDGWWPFHSDRDLTSSFNRCKLNLRHDAKEQPLAVKYLSNKAWGSVVYTTAKGCSLGTTQCGVPGYSPCRGILAIYHKTLLRLYKRVTNVIRACTNTYFVIPEVYCLIYHGCQPISIQSSNHPVYNDQYTTNPRALSSMFNYTSIAGNLLGCVGQRYRLVVFIGDYSM